MDVLAPLFFGLGLANSLCLIVIFVIRKLRLELLMRIGWVYLLLAVPAIWALVVALQEQPSWQYAVFLGIFLAFLAVEALYDWILKIPFRETMDWRWLVPYVFLYISSNYGFVVMTWRTWVAGGIVLLVLFVLQILANVLTHPRKPAVTPRAGGE